MRKVSILLTLWPLICGPFINRHSSYFVFFLLLEPRTEPKALPLLGKRSTMELNPQFHMGIPKLLFIWNYEVDSFYHLSVSETQFLSFKQGWQCPPIRLLQNLDVIFDKVTAVMTSTIQVEISYFLHSTHQSQCSLVYRRTNCLSFCRNQGGVGKCWGIFQCFFHHPSESFSWNVMQSKTLFYL